MTQGEEHLIVALDLPSVTDARRLVSELDGVVSFFKIGLELYSATGPEFVRELISQRKKVFLDCKFLDIEETVRRASQVVAGMGVSFLTVHESGKTVNAAVQGCRGSELKILAVTVLTSMDASDLNDMGISGSVEELVLSRARRALAAGSHGVVASGQEARKIRGLSKDAIIVTPGIRPAGADVHEQKRATTPRQAIEAGADYLVVGRPIRDAINPREAAQKVVSEMQNAFEARSSQKSAPAISPQ